MTNGNSNTNPDNLTVSRDTAELTGSETPAAALAKSDLNLAVKTLPQLRTREEREAWLAAFALEMIPDRIDPELWQRWLRDGTGLYKMPLPKRPATHGQALSRDLERQSKKVKCAVSDVTKARETLAREGQGRRGGGGTDQGAR